MSQPCCGTCAFFEPIVVFDSDEPGAEGRPETICRRFPPTDGWPSVLADDWCGEWSCLLPSAVAKERE